MGAFLPYAVYTVRGDDAQAFLQGQLTCDMRMVSPTQWHYGGYCLPNGKVLAVFSLQQTEDGYLLALPDELADTVMRRLQMFVLRSKVVLARSGLHLYARDTGGITLCAGESAPAAATDSRAYFLSRIQHGHAEIFAATSGEFLPQMLGLQDSGALSFTKGCYVGQEAVARLQYKGSNRRVTARAKAHLPDVPAPGTELFAQDLRAGTVLLAARGADAVWVQAVVQDRFLETALFAAGQDVPLIFVHGEAWHGKN